MIPQETVELILDSARIEDVVGDFVTLKRRGANFVACCPFHNEKTPSFYVSPVKGIYKCFGCGKSGSAVGFVMEQEHCSYTEALRYLAKKYNIEIQEKEDDPEEIIQRQRKESLLLVSEFAQKFFASQLASGEGRAVGYNYFRSRGLEDATIEKFGLGWAPSGKTTFIDAAVAAGYKMEYIIAAGLAVQREDGTVVDKFRERVMFPIHSVSGRVVAFSGRTLHADNPAKYVNSAETEIYVKSRNLLGIWFAKPEISRQHKCILVEGNVDMVTMHQLGITNVVASCGTSLTVEQIRLIKKFTDDVTIMYDGDSAGIHAALRGINMVLAEGLNVKIVLLPEGEDPDSFGRSHTLQEVQDYIAAGERDFIGFKTDLLLGEAGSDPLKKANLINDIADTIAEIPDAVKRTMYVQAVSDKFGIESSILFDRIGKERKKMKEEAIKERERQQRRQASADEQLPPPPTDGEGYVPYEPELPPVDMGPVSWVPENRNLEVPERELVTFLVRNGCDLLEFESDSQYYAGDEDKMTVADFIRGALEDDGTVMANSVYRRIYDAFFAQYDEGYEQDEIVKHLLDSSDRQMADMVADFCSEKHQITITAFEASLTTTESWLVNYVPKTIMLYAEARIKDRLENLRKSLANADADAQAGLLQEIVKLQGAQRKIKQKIGRDKN